MADEYKYICEIKVYERAIAFIEAQNLSASAIQSQLVAAISSLQLNPERCVGFLFDGANVMSSKTVSSKWGPSNFEKKFKNGIYVHCHSHRLNLALCSAAKSEPLFKDM